MPDVAASLIAAGSLEHQQAMVKLFADALDFVLMFDRAKIMCPAIQNDFAFYRRSLAKMSADEKIEPEMKVNAERSQAICMFIAESIPMMRVLSNAFSIKFGSASEKTHVLELLSEMANILCSVVMNKKFESAKTNEYCLHAMTGAIVLYDHVDPNGAFAKSSRIKIKQCAKQVNGRQDLINALMYSTRHYNSAPTKIRSILEAGK